ncbi:uncharacterized protein [Temnothorax longispinosus]|uniref:uncharacterized protein isoform X2 n=1 Tax=Temnothorax longispinosus TaxID=300112 RepID=UPI003A993BAA
MRGGAGDGDGPSIVTVPASASLNILTAEDSMSDDVFEMDDDRSSTVTNVVSGGLTPATVERPLEKTPSPTGYRDYKPPAEVLSNNYSTTFRTTSDFDNLRSALKRDQEKEDNFAHKTILLGDSGVGKTSLLVQFDTGRFQPGNFAATVGIGFTVIAFRDSSCSRTVPRNFPSVHSIAPARRGRFVPAKVRTPRKCQIAFARFERRTVLSLDRLSRTSSARRGSRRRKRKEENRLGRGAVRREKGEETPGRRRNARRGSRHARTHSRTHVRRRTYIRNTYERTSETNRVGARESGERFSDLGVSS